MISDIRESESGAVITANIIIGGGAAAIAMPRELKDMGQQVVIFEFNAFQFGENLFLDEVYCDELTAPRNINILLHAADNLYIVGSSVFPAVNATPERIAPPHLSVKDLHVHHGTIVSNGSRLPAALDCTSGSFKYHASIAPAGK